MASRQEATQGQQGSPGLILQQAGSAGSSHSGLAARPGQVSRSTWQQHPGRHSLDALRDAFVPEIANSGGPCDRNRRMSADVRRPTTQGAAGDKMKGAVSCNSFGSELQAVVTSLPAATAQPEFRPLSASAAADAAACAATSAATSASPTAATSATLASANAIAKSGAAAVAPPECNAVAVSSHQQNSADVASSSADVGTASADVATAASTDVATKSVALAGPPEPKGDGPRSEAALTEATPPLSNYTWPPMEHATPPFSNHALHPIEHATEPLSNYTSPLIKHAMAPLSHHPALPPIKPTASELSRTMHRRTHSTPPGVLQHLPETAPRTALETAPVEARKKKQSFVQWWRNSQKFPT